MTSAITVSLLNTLNTNHTNSEHGVDDPKGINRIPALVFSGTLLAIGTVGNSHALIINLQRYKKQKNRNNPYVAFVLSLAVLDLFVSSFILSLDIVDTSTQFTLLSEDLCKVFRYFQAFLHISSILHVLVISFHCWRMVCFPHGTQIDGSRALKLCLGSYVIAFFPSLPTAIMSGYSTKTFNGENGHVCFINEAYNGTKGPKVYMGFISIAFVILMIVICILYIVLIRCRWKIQQQRKAVAKSTEKKKEAGKTTVILIILTSIFILSYIPFLILGLIAVVNKDFRKGWNVATLATYRIFARFPHLNNILNPFIYGYKDTDFRKRLLRMYRRCFRNAYFQNATPNNMV